MMLPEGWKEVTIGDIAELITSGATPTVGNAELYSNEKQGIPFFRIQNVGINRLILSDLKYVTPEVHNRHLKRSQIRPGDILMTITGRLGTAAVVPPEIKEANINQHICLIRLKEKVAAPHYVMFHLNSEETHKEIMRKQHGATRIALNHRTVGSLKVNLPSIDTQRKIASILQRAHRLTGTREQANQLTNKIIQSVFLKMFGDPIHSLQVVPTFELGEVCTKVTDGTHDTPKYVSPDIGIPLIMARNVREGKLDFSDIHHISKQDHQQIIKRSYPQKGDILYVNIGANRATAAEVDVDFEFSIKNVALFKLDRTRISPKYLLWLLNYPTFKSHVISQSRGGAQNFLHLDFLRKLRIPVPPLELQNNFNSRVEVVESLRRRQWTSTQEIDELFHSLMHKAFRGELVV